MRYSIIIFLVILLSYSCESDSSHPNEQEGDQFVSDTIKAPAEFSNEGFDDKLKYELLLEAHICNPNYSDTTSDNTVPCSSRFFRFFEWNRKRNLDNAFMLQVHAGVNNYPYRRLLIFTREEGELILVNGINGYLIEQRTRPNEIDDLVVGIIDDLGNNNFDRYDVVLRYEDGKYQFKEAIGDLKGPFESDTLKEAASRAIKRRIEEKELIF
ncbi:MAG: hypothetical protein ACQERC_03800 [Bacteroidota bacterium]